MELPKRKPNRLKSYDYSQNGAYFITISTSDKKCIFWEDESVFKVIDKKYYSNDSIVLSPIGKAVDFSINQINFHYPDIYVSKYVIMPNHVHILMIIDSGRLITAPTDEKRKTISDAVRGMKAYVSKSTGQSIWQKSFYDHIIRNEKQLYDIWKYIDQNPLKWLDDKLFVEI